MKRKVVYQQHKWKRKVFAAILLGFCFGSLVLMQTQYSRIMSLRPRFVPKPKIAFLFIARNRLPLEMVWDKFFKGEESRFSIFVHSRPRFLFSKGTTRSIYFLDRQVNDSIQVDWGEASMIEAERILLGHALVDPFNERFVFLSDSCIPLYNFSYTYNYIMSTSTSFVDSFADTKEGRYNPKMAPVIPVHNWRKGSQWAVLTRKHAEIVVNDTTVFPWFQQHCKRKSLPEFWRERSFPADPSKEHNCIPDEHYVQTLLAQVGLEGELTRRSLTYSSWDLSSSKDHERRGWHPATYKYADATPQLIQSIKNYHQKISRCVGILPVESSKRSHPNRSLEGGVVPIFNPRNPFQPSSWLISYKTSQEIDNIYYETEYRREWCRSKGKPSPCFLFARKFTRPAALRLLDMSVLGANSNEATRTS